MGYMPQTRMLFSFSVLRNVEMALDGEAEREAAARRHYAVPDTLAQAKGQQALGWEASGGGFYRRIAKPRRLLLLDEPTSVHGYQGHRSHRSYSAELLRKSTLPARADLLHPLAGAALRLAEEAIFLPRAHVGAKGYSMRDPQKTSAPSFSALAHIA